MKDVNYSIIEDAVQNEIPVVIPTSVEDALADIEQSEIEFKEGKGIAWEDVKHMMEERICSYAY